MAVRGRRSRSIELGHYSKEKEEKTIVEGG